MVHELGHMFGLSHCVYFQCNMNGSNHLTESDSQPLELCPVCLHKLEDTVGFNAINRYKELLEFFTTNAAAFEKEKKWLAGRLLFVEEKLNSLKGHTKTTT